jgi:hypothetical protein
MRRQQEVVDTGCCRVAGWGSCLGILNLGGLTLTSRRPVMSRPGRCILDCLFVYTPSAADALAQEAVSGSCAALPRVFLVFWGYGMRARAIMRTGRAIYAVVPEMTIFRGLPIAEGERIAIPLGCFRTLDVLVASHLRWPKTAEFHVCASTAAQRGGGGIWTPLVSARRHCDTDFDSPSANALPRRDIAAGAFWRL